MRTFSWEHFGRFVMVGSNKTYAEVDTEQRPPTSQKSVPNTELLH